MRPAFCALIALVCAAGARADESPVAEWQPNLYGNTGVLRTTSARVRSASALGFTGFGTLADDYLIEGLQDANIFLGGHLLGGVGIAELVELGFATRVASNGNTARAQPQFSLGDLYTSAKFGMTFLPVAAGLQVQWHLPTQVSAFGYDVLNSSISAQALVTADLLRSLKIPVRAHLNAGYVFELGKTQGGELDQNRNFYNGPDGQLLALATSQWFYDQLVAGLAVEVPLAYATPFVEAWYQAALGVPNGRGPGGRNYDLLGDGHVVVTPGVRVAVSPSFAFDAAVDVGLTGNGGFPAEAAKLTDGTPPNPLWLARIGVSAIFDPFGAENAGVVVSAGQGGQLRACLTDERGEPAAGALVDGAALKGARLIADDGGCFLTPVLPPGEVELSAGYAGGPKTKLMGHVESGRTTQLTAQISGKPAAAAVAPSGDGRVVGWVTNKEDELVDAEIEIWDARGLRAVGRSQGGAFEAPAAAGRANVIAKADGLLANGAEVNIDPGRGERLTIVLKKVPKQRKASLKPDRVQPESRVPFEFKKARLQAAAEFVLDDIVDILLRNPNLRVRVEVYAEALATPEETQKLADERAAVVVDYLAEHGVHRSRLERKGVALNPGDPDKARRIELPILQ